METKFYNFYIAPSIEVVEAAVEAGFSSSDPSNVEDPEIDEIQGWY